MSCIQRLWCCDMGNPLIESVVRRVVYSCGWTAVVCASVYGSCFETADTASAQNMCTVRFDFVFYVMVDYPN
jgi:hypothetical protein